MRNSDIATSSDFLVQLRSSAEGFNGFRIKYIKRPVFPNAQTLVSTSDPMEPRRCPLVLVENETNGVWYDHIYHEVKIYINYMCCPSNIYPHDFFVDVT